MNAHDVWVWWWEHREFTLPITLAVVGSLLRKMEPYAPELVGALLAVLPDVERAASHGKAMVRPKADG